ncbi:hypothetical protein BaRGS_00005254 [Batillaria attramentaria]|uniref:N-acyl-aliphatic-L-amino acid amidohydrolase n=1 Tax=Batillaria attramentaria TaxID=370345 RepID=A0ABD0LVC0_9CAEN
MSMASDQSEDPAVTNFRTYLQINTSQPKPDYGEAIMFYMTMAQEIGLDFKTVEVAAGKDMAILTWRGQEPSLPSVMLYCHTDVVPVFPEHWKYDPFGAVKDENGDIYARGAQDMKCLGIQYLEAIRQLKKEGSKPKRTVHIIFGPDEEIGGKEGMALFVQRQEFPDLNIGFALDEGLASPTSEFRLFYGERACWWFSVTFSGKPGHGSAFIEDTAISKLNKVMNRALQFRAEQEKRLNSDSSLTLGDVTSLNINLLQGGVQYNVVPSEMTAGFDVRITPTVDLKKFEEEITQWCKDAGPDFTIKFFQKGMCQKRTSTDSSDPWWAAFSSACQSMGLELKKEIFPAGTDGRYLRELDIPVLGFSPMNNTPILLHDHNEFLNEKVFLRGIKIYEKIIPALANV